MLCRLFLAAGRTVAFPEALALFSPHCSESSSRIASNCSSAEACGFSASLDLLTGGSSSCTYHLVDRTISSNIARAAASSFLSFFLFFTIIFLKNLIFSLSCQSSTSSAGPVVHVLYLRKSLEMVFSMQKKRTTANCRHLSRINH